MQFLRILCWPLNKPPHRKHALGAVHHAHRARHARRAIVWTCALVGLPAAAILPPLLLAPEKAPPENLEAKFVEIPQISPLNGGLNAISGSGGRIDYWPPSEAGADTAQPVPEPGSALLLATAVAVLAVWRRQP